GYIAAFVNEQIYKILFNKPAVFNRDKLAEITNSYWLCNSKDLLNLFPEFKYTSLYEGIKYTYKWYKDNGMTLPSGAKVG
ncbi:MAG: hypothetical protein N3E40_05930, partial [Dehalococcoidia bacterium]|nr:hypothetical protein [Dehalococcoidia bacterium]